MSCLGTFSVTAQQLTGSWAGLTLAAETEGSSRPAYNFSATITQVTDSEPRNLKQSILLCLILTRSHRISDATYDKL